MKRSILLIVVLAAFVAIGFTSQNAYAQGAITGVVYDADGNVVAGAMVNIIAEDRVRGERPFRAQYETGENGVFGWREVPQGAYILRAGAREVGMTTMRVGVRDGHVVRLEVVIARADRERPEIEYGSLLGQVVDADGNPVANAVVTVGMIRENENGRRNVRRIPLRVVTNERGLFEMEEVPAGNVVVRAIARELGRGRAVVEVIADEDVRVRVELAGRG